jgi:hypothetical protein
MSETIPADYLDPLAVAKANKRLWENNPELHGRQLTMSREDTAYRKQWMQYYHEAEKETPKPPPLKITPTPVESPPASTIADSPKESCPLQDMNHEDKMAEAINRAPITDDVREELGDIKTLVASMAIVSGILIAIAWTGYGAIAEAIAAALLIIGAAVSGVQIGQGINSLIDFYQKTRCDTAKTPADLDDAGKSFADAIAKMGVGGLMLLLSLLGARGKTIAGKEIPAESPPVEPLVEPKISPKPPSYPNDPLKPPAEGWEWRGKGTPESGKGSWYNPETGESLRPDLNHPDPIGPHYDYKAPDNTRWRYFPDGTLKPKK